MSAPNAIAYLARDTSNPSIPHQVNFTYQESSGWHQPPELVGPVLSGGIPGGIQSLGYCSLARKPNGTYGIAICWQRATWDDGGWDGNGDDTFESSVELYEREYNAQTQQYQWNYSGQAWSASTEYYKSDYDLDNDISWIPILAIGQKGNRVSLQYDSDSLPVIAFADCIQTSERWNPVLQDYVTKGTWADNRIARYDGSQWTVQRLAKTPSRWCGDSNIELMLINDSPHIITGTGRGYFHEGGPLLYAKNSSGGLMPDRVYTLDAGATCFFGLAVDDGNVPWVAYSPVDGGVLYAQLFTVNDSNPTITPFEIYDGGQPLSSFVVGFDVRGNVLAPVIRIAHQDSNLDLWVASGSQKGERVWRETSSSEWRYNFNFNAIGRLALVRTGLFAGTALVPARKGTAYLVGARIPNL